MITVLFLCGVTLVNAFMPYAAGLSFARPFSVGGSSSESPLSGAFMESGAVFYNDIPLPTLSVMHDALAESSGQSVYTAATDGVRDFVRRFSLPARGINWGVIHEYNAVDVAGACGSGVYAAAAGQVVDVRNGWESGYGNYVDIDHGNGVITRYAHAEKILVKVGQMVAGGDVIARMGNTGNSTGCHVHFEVLGSAVVVNPFAR